MASRVLTGLRRSLLGALVLVLGTSGAAAASAQPASAQPLSAQPVGIDTALVLERGAGDDPLAGAVLHDQGDSAADRALPAETDPRRHALLDAVATQPQGTWLGGWVPTAEVAQRVRDTVASAAGAVPTLVLYDIPGRDCGSYSAGGAADERAYGEWIAQVAAGLGAGRAVVVLEPDALAQLDCLDDRGRAARLRMLSAAVATLAARPGALVYLDAGHSGWHAAEEMAGRLRAAGVAQARGFALNVSNFQATPDLVRYAGELSARTGGAHAVLDTGRNGNGPAPASALSWCNPDGRALGAEPTTATGSTVVDALLWIKAPGESDGACGPGQLPAGQLDVERTLDLAEAAGY